MPCGLKSTLRIVGQPVGELLKFVIDGNFHDPAGRFSGRCAEPVQEALVNVVGRGPRRQRCDLSERLSDIPRGRDAVLRLPRLGQGAILVSLPTLLRTRSEAGLDEATPVCEVGRARHAEIPASTTSDRGDRASRTTPACHVNS